MGFEAFQTLIYLVD